jgi:hypothetical protein
MEIVGDQAEPANPKPGRLNWLPMTDRFAPEAVARKLISFCVLPYQSAN